MGIDTSSKETETLQRISELEHERDLIEQNIVQNVATFLGENSSVFGKCEYPYADDKNKVKILKTKKGVIIISKKFNPTSDLEISIVPPTDQNQKHQIAGCIVTTVKTNNAITGPRSRSGIGGAEWSTKRDDLDLHWISEFIKRFSEDPESKLHNKISSLLGTSDNIKGKWGKRDYYKVFLRTNLTKNSFAVVVQELYPCDISGSGEYWTYVLTIADEGKIKEQEAYDAQGKNRRKLEVDDLLEILGGLKEENIERGDPVSIIKKLTHFLTKALLS